MTAYRESPDCWNIAGTHWYLELSVGSRPLRLQILITMYNKCIYLVILYRLRYQRRAQANMLRRKEKRKWEVKGGEPLSGKRTQNQWVLIKLHSASSSTNLLVLMCFVRSCCRIKHQRRRRKKKRMRKMMFGNGMDLIPCDRVISGSSVPSRISLI